MGCGSSKEQVQVHPETPSQEPTFETPFDKKKEPKQSVVKPPMKHIQTPISNHNSLDRHHNKEKATEKHFEKNLADDKKVTSFEIENEVKVVKREFKLGVGRGKKVANDTDSKAELNRKRIQEEKRLKLEKRRQHAALVLERKKQGDAPEEDDNQDKLSIGGEGGSSNGEGEEVEEGEDGEEVAEEENSS